MFSPPLAPDNNRKPFSAQWRQWGTGLLFGIAVIVIVLILLGITATKTWFWGLL
jgi:hypothetical protein